jgi:hypothetical protein
VLNVKCLSENVLLHLFLGTHFIGSVDVHSNIEEILVEERYTENANYIRKGEGRGGKVESVPNLNTKSGGGLVGAQAIGPMESLYSSDGLLMEFFGIGGVVEVKIAAEDLIGTLARQNHFNTKSLDATAKKEHRGACANSGDVVCLQMPNDTLDGVKSVLDSEGELVVSSSKELGNL